MILAVASSLMISMNSCSDRDNFEKSTLPNENKSTKMANREAYDIYELHGESPKILNVKDFPLSDFETEGIANAMQSRACVTTDHFVGNTNGAHYYHVTCGTSHWVVAWSPRNGWSQPWQETATDQTVWHGFDKRELRFVSPFEVYFGDERLKEETGYYADIVANAILHPELSRKAIVQCSFKDHTNNATIVLTQVYGDGQPSTYWVSYVHADGTVTTWQNPGSPCSQFSDIP